MNKNINKDKLNEIIDISKNILKVFYVLVLVLALYVLLKIIKELNLIDIFLTILNILSPLFFGILIAWLLNPFVKWLETKKVRRFLGVLLSYILLVGAIIFLLKALFPILYTQSIDLVENIPNIFSSLKDWINNLFEKINTNVFNINSFEAELYNKLDVFSSGLAITLPSNIINIISIVVSSIGKLLIGLVIGFYLLLTCNNLGNSFLDFIPRRYRKNINKICRNINKSLRDYVNGALLDSTVVFLISTLAFACVGLKAPILFGLFCGLMNIIPYAGPYIGGAPAVIVGFSQSTGIGIACLLAIVIIQLIEGNFLQTIIISKTTKLNPVVIIIGLLIFGHFFGIIGMLLSTPIISVIKVILTYFDDKYDILNFEKD